MSKNTKHAGMRLPEMVLNSAGVWVKSKFAGMRVCSNTCVSDFQWFNLHRPNKRTHTSPVQRTMHNDGHDNPARMRAAATKEWHARKAL